MKIFILLYHTFADYTSFFANFIYKKKKCRFQQHHISIISQKNELVKKNIVTFHIFYVLNKNLLCNSYNLSIAFPFTMCYTISAERKVHSNEKVKPISNCSTCQTRTAERIKKYKFPKSKKDGKDQWKPEREPSRQYIPNGVWKNSKGINAAAIRII